MSVVPSPSSHQKRSMAAASRSCQKKQTKQTKTATPIKAHSMTELCERRGGGEGGGGLNPKKQKKRRKGSVIQKVKKEEKKQINDRSRQRSGRGKKNQCPLRLDNGLY